MSVRIEAPSVAAPHGGLLSVAEVRDIDSHAWYDGAEYQSILCGGVRLLPGALCGMAEVTVGAVDGTLTVTVSNASVGLYTVTVEYADAEAEPVAESDEGFGPFFSVQFDVTNPAAVVTVSVAGPGVSAETEVTLTAGDAPEVVLAVGSKEFDGFESIEGEGFYVYKGVQCKYLGGDWGAQASAALEAGESRAVEEGFLRSSLAISSTSDLTPTPGTAVSWLQAVSILEKYLGENYSGRGIIHAPRSAVVFGIKQGALNSRGDTFTVTTEQGVPVANGAGYEANLGPDGSAADDGETWVYLTGSVILGRGQVNVHEQPDVENNNLVGLAERGWLPLVDCFTVAILVENEVS